MLSLNLLWWLPASAGGALLLFGVAYPVFVDGPARRRRLAEAERRANYWQGLARDFQRVADARHAELMDLHDQRDAALVEDMQVAELDALWDLPAREPRS